MTAVAVSPRLRTQGWFVTRVSAAILLVLCVVVLGLSRALVVRFSLDAASLGTSCSLPPAAQESLTHIMQSVPYGIEAFGIHLAAVACGALWALGLAVELSKELVLSVLRPVTSSPGFLDFAPFEAWIAKRLSRFGAVATVVTVVAILPKAASIEFSDLAGLFTIALPLLACASTLFYWMSLRSYSRATPERVVELAKHLSHPARRARFWIEGFFILVFSILFCEGLVPLLFRQIEAAATQFRNRIAVVLDDSAIERLGQACRQGGASDGDAREVLQETLKNLQYNAARDVLAVSHADIEKLKATLRELFPALFAWIATGVIVAPFLVRPRGSESLLKALQQQGGIQPLL